MKYLRILFTIFSVGLSHPLFASEPARTIEFRYQPTAGEAVFSKINEHQIDDTTIGSTVKMLLKLPNGDLRLLEARACHKDDPTFIAVTIRDPGILIDSGESEEPLTIFSLEVKLVDGEPYNVIETSEGTYSLTVSWGSSQTGPNKTE